MRFGNHEVWSRIPKHVMNSPHGLENNPWFYSENLETPRAIHRNQNIINLIQDWSSSRRKIRGQKKKQLAIWKFIQFIAVRGRTKENRVKGNPL
jgi:hypothetical protein